MAQKLNTGTSIVDYLKSVGKDSSFKARAQLAVDLGIVKKASDYSGSAQQNTALLKSAKSNASKQDTKAATSQKDTKADTNKKDTKADTTKNTNTGKVESKVDTKVTTGVNSTATEVIDNITQLVAAAIPDAGQYSYKEFKTMAMDNPQLKSAQELAKLYGLDYNLENIYDTLMKSVDAGYDARYNQQGQAESKYYSNAATAQSTLADTLRKQQSQAILAGSNKGMQAAQALSAMLGTSQQFAANATQLAMDRQQIGKEEAVSRAQTGVTALNTYNQMGQQLADVSKNLYSSDTSKYVGQLDYNASINTANAQMQAQAMASKAQWESNYAQSIASAYQAYYNGQITLEQARIQADAAIQSAKQYGLDAANVTAQANKQIAQTNKDATLGAASIGANAQTQAATIGANATTQAANAAAQANVDAAKASAQGYVDSQNAANSANAKNSSANLVTGIISGFNAGSITGADAMTALDGYYAAGLIDQSTYNSTKGIIGGKKETTTDTTNTQTNKKTDTPAANTTGGQPYPAPYPAPGGGYQY